MSVVAKDKPVTVKTNEGLPQDGHEMIMLRNDVIAWTSLDPGFEKDVGTSACCYAFGAFFFVPCMWPALLLMFPLLFAEKTSHENRIRNQYWILTDTELKVFTKDNAACCLGKTGDSLQTIPLDSITDCGSNDARNGCVNACVKPLPLLYVDTDRFVWHEGSPDHEAMGYGLARQDWFIGEVLNRRDILVQGKHSMNACCEGAVVATPFMDRGGRCAISAADRMKDITEQHNSGVLTREEFLEKRKDVIDSI